MILLKSLFVVILLTSKISLASDLEPLVTLSEAGDLTEIPMDQPAEDFEVEPLSDSQVN